MLLRPDDTKCTSKYLLYAILSDDVYRQAVGKNNTSTVAHVNVNDVKQFKIPLPSLDKQIEFAVFVNQTDKSKYFVEEALKIYISTLYSVIRTQNAHPLKRGAPHDQL